MTARCAKRLIRPNQATVQLGTGSYSLTLGTDIEIAKSVTFDGAGISSTESIDGSQNSDGNTVAPARIFRVDEARRSRSMVLR